jgi:hypothetical protein
MDAPDFSFENWFFRRIFAHSKKIFLPLSKQFTTAEMMEATTKIKKTSDTIFRTLKKEQPILLEKELKRLYAISKIQKIKGTVKKNTLPMSEIVKEVNTVRKERHEATQNRI